MENKAASCLFVTAQPTFGRVGGSSTCPTIRLTSHGCLLMREHVCCFPENPQKQNNIICKYILSIYIINIMFKFKQGD
jgi:hypothetical protein